MTRRARLLAVVCTIAAAALGVISSTQTWLVATLADAAGDQLAVPGAAAVPVLAPLSLAVLALGLALSIVGTVLRYAFGVLTVAAGALLAVLTGQVAVVQPVSAVASTVTDATGITGPDAVARLVTAVDATPWPSLTLAGWLLLVAAGVLTLATARRWQNLGRRFRTAETAMPAHDRAVPLREAEAVPPATDEAPAPLDAVDSWDGLSRGEDPTAGSGSR